MFNSKHPARATKATLNFISNKQDAIFMAYLLQRAQKSRRRNYETPFTLYGLNNHSSYLVGGNLPHKHTLKLRDAVIRGLLGCHIQAIGIWEWRLVYLRSKRAEAMFVGFHLGSHGHRHQRAAVESVVEGDNRRASRRVACNLDSVLDSFRPAVEKYGFFWKVSRSQIDNTFC